MRKSIRWILLAFAVICCFVGCSVKSEDRGGKISQEEFPWLRAFKDSVHMSEDTPSFYEIRRSDLRDPVIDFAAEQKKSVSAWGWNARYVLTSAKGQGEKRYFLNRMKTDQGVEESREILTDWQERPDGFAVCMDVIKEDMLAVLYAESDPDWQGEPIGYWLVMLGQKENFGEFLEAKDVTDIYVQLGEKGFVPGSGNWWCDAEGNQYLTVDGTQLAEVSNLSETVLITETDSNTEEKVTAAFHMPDGSLVFAKSIVESGKTLLFWLGLPEAEEHILWESPVIGLNQFTVTPEGILYYTSGSVLIQWNLQTGEQKRLFQFYNRRDIVPGGLGMGDTCYLTVGGEHEIYLYVPEKETVMVLTDKPLKDEDSIRCVTLLDPNYVRTCAAVFSREPEGIMIRVDARVGRLPADRENYFSVLSAEIAAGHAPDLMLLEYGQMKILQSKGLLEPLDGYLNGETVDAMYGGVREGGSIDGKLYGVAFETTDTIMVTSDLVWQGEEWTLREILDLIESGKLEGLIAGCDPEANLVYLSGEYLQNSPFVDFEKGESHFEDEDFIRLLEACKRYGTVSRQDGLQLLEEGKMLGAVDAFFNNSDFINKLREYKGRFHYVGFPGQAGGIGRVNMPSYLVMSRDAKDKEALGRFFNYLLSEEAQEMTQLNSVSRRRAENLLRDYELSMQEMAQYENVQIVQTYPLPYEECIAQYMDILERAEVPKAPYGVTVWNIVSEVTGAFWDGSKSAEEVAEVIDNRVQLYLDENAE